MDKREKKYYDYVCKNNKYLPTIKIREDFFRENKNNIGEVWDFCDKNIRHYSGEPPRLYNGVKINTYQRVEERDGYYYSYFVYGMPVYEDHRSSYYKSWCRIRDKQESFFTDCLSKIESFNYYVNIYEKRIFSRKHIKSKLEEKIKQIESLVKNCSIWGKPEPDGIIKKSLFFKESLINIMKNSNKKLAKIRKKEKTKPKMRLIRESENNGGKEFFQALFIHNKIKQENHHG